jgi:tellurite resistance protein
MAKPSKIVKALSPEEALVYVMVTASGVDRVMSDIELGAIGSIVKLMPAFDRFDKPALVKTAEACGALLRQEDGLDKVIALVERSLSDRLRETAYALAVEIAAADAVANLEELRLLEMLAERLDIDELTVAAVKRSAQLRYRKM